MINSYQKGQWLKCKIKDCKKWHQIEETLVYPDKSIGVKTNHTEIFVDVNFFKVWIPKEDEFMWSLKYKDLVKFLAYENGDVKFKLSDGKEDIDKIYEFEPYRKEPPLFIKELYL